MSGNRTFLSLSCISDLYFLKIVASSILMDLRSDVGSDEEEEADVIEIKRATRMT
jgi:hypothetical protein